MCPVLPKMEEKTRLVVPRFLRRRALCAEGCLYHGREVYIQ